MRLNLTELRATVSIAAQSTGITFLPARTWSGDPVSRVITYPERAITANLRGDNPLLDIGPPTDELTAQRRLSSLFSRLGAVLVEGAPLGLQQQAVRFARRPFTPEMLLRCFWHIEHGIVEARLRARSEWATELGYYPAFGVEWRDYPLDDLAVRLYGTFANPQLSPETFDLWATLEPLRVATSRTDRWRTLIGLQEQLAPLLTGVPTPEGIPEDTTTVTYREAPTYDNGEFDACAGAPAKAYDLDDELDTEFDGGDDAYDVDYDGDRCERFMQTPEELLELGKRDADPSVKRTERRDDYAPLHGGNIDPIAGSVVHSEDIRYSDDVCANIDIERQLLAPTIAAFSDALSRILGVSRGVQMKLVNQSKGRIDPRKLVRTAATGRANCFVRWRYLPRGSRFSIAFLVDDSGSMMRFSEARFNPQLEAAHPAMMEIDAIRLLALALAEAAFNSEGKCAITAINHPAVNEWTRANTAKMIGRFIATGGSEPDRSLVAALSRLDELPAPRIVVFLTDGEVATTEALGARQPIIPIVPAKFRGTTIYGHPVVRLDQNVVANFAARVKEIIGLACAEGGLTRSIAS
jgi:hypothetical protein